MHSPIKPLLLSIVVIALGVGFYFFNGYFRAVAPSGDVACTMETFLCPDGSYVGRGGPSCAFAPCPDQPSFTGTLTQSSDGFALIVAAPEGGLEVAYRMPLQIKVSNALGTLVGKKVQAFGSFTEGATLSVDRLEALTGDAADPTLGEVSVGKSVFVNGVRITLNRIAQDSRCPIDVQCIQAGSVTANVTLKSDTDSETKDIVSAHGAVPFDSYQVSLESVSPARKAGTALRPEEYTLTFRVRSN